MVTITVERVTKKRMLEAWILRGGKSDDAVPMGLTVWPKATVHKPIGGFGRIEIYILERISQELARETILHELLHAAQFLCGCQVEEKLPTDFAEVLLKGLVERKR